MSVNYDYVIDTIKNLYPEKAPLCLDFGCGAGQIVERGLESGLDFYGADPYPENRSEHYEESVKEKASLDGHISQIENDKIPFPDNHFDVVISNVVFEHIADPKKALNEIARVLKPGGAFLALFPTKDVWWEGHVKLYFAHWFRPKSKLMHLYLKSMKTIGLGLKSDSETPDEWATHYQKYLQEYCFYRPMKEISALWQQVFNAEPESLAYEYMLFRLSQSRCAPLLNNFAARFLLEQICRIRAGRVLLVRL